MQHFSHGKHGSQARAPNDDVPQHGGLTRVKSCSLGLQRVSLILNIHAIMPEYTRSQWLKSRVKNICIEKILILRSSLNPGLALTAFRTTRHYPRYGQLTPAKKKYPLTSVTWPYRKLRFRSSSSSCVLFLILTADHALVFDWIAGSRLINL